MELRPLRYFVAVAETESLTLAAKARLHTSQPSLGRQIRDLEEQIGAQLIMRTARGIELTPVGSSLSRSRPPGAVAGGCGSRSCTPRRSSRQTLLRHRLPHRTRIEVDARSLADLARRTPEHRRDDIESILAAARHCPFTWKSRCGFSSTRRRHVRFGVPLSRQGAPDGDLAE
jgi:Bacterial regulatory helix-turn-helix protein, lysR family